METENKIRLIRRYLRMGRSYNEILKSVMELEDEGKVEVDIDKRGNEQIRTSQKGREEIEKLIDKVTEQEKNNIRIAPVDNVASRRSGYLHFKNELENVYKLKDKPNVKDALKAAQDLGYFKEVMGPGFREELGKCKLFEIDENVKKLLLLTNNEILPHKKMPFDYIFIDTDVYIDGWWFKGLMLAYNTAYAEDSLMLMTFIGEQKEEDWPCDHMLWYSFYTKKAASDLSKRFFDETRYPKSIYGKKGLQLPVPVERRKTAVNKLAVFCMNFLDFLNNPDVQVVEISRSQKNIERRQRHGKPVLPPSRRVTVKGDLKVYIERIVQHLDNFHYTHKFFVRGHYMHFWNKKKYHKLYQLLEENRLSSLNRKHVRSDGSIISLTYEVGQDGIIKVWRWPFIKGQGILIDKTYRVTK